MFLSEFYVLRRSSIKDVSALLGFVIGWFASAPFAWPYIKAGFDGGDPTKGVFRFVIVVFAGALSGGGVGMLAGSLGGMAWERIHRYRRRAQPDVPSARTDTIGASPGRTDERPAVRIPLSSIRFESGVLVADYLALAATIGPERHDVKRTEAALARSIAVTAWEGNRLVGVARVVSDGYFFAALADLMVDPAYRRSGIGRELLNRALAKTPRGSLFIGARPGTTAFFDRLGCERGLAGFTMLRPAKPSDAIAQVPA